MGRMSLLLFFRLGLRRAETSFSECGAGCVGKNSFSAPVRLLGSAFCKCGYNARKRKKNTYHFQSSMTSYSQSVSTFFCPSECRPGSNPEPQTSRSPATWHTFEVHRGRPATFSPRDTLLDLRRLSAHPRTLRQGAILEELQVLVEPEAQDRAVGRAEHSGALAEGRN